MQYAFIYLWFDRARKMFYLGSHLGEPNDGYFSSSHWLNGEIKFRPNDFVRRIIKFVDPADLRKEEYRFIKMIKDDEFGIKYYNIKSGKPKGAQPWNKGRTLSEDHRQKLVNAFRGRPAWNKGLANPVAATNGKKSAEKVAKTVTGRKMIILDNKRKWAYPSNEGWYIKNGEEKVFIDFSSL